MSPYSANRKTSRNRNEKHPMIRSTVLPQSTAIAPSSTISQRSGEGVLGIVNTSAPRIISRVKYGTQNVNA